MMISGVFFLLKAVPVHTMKAYSGRRGITPLTLKFSTRWRHVVSFMPWPPYLWERTPVPSEQEAEVSQSQSGLFGEETNLQPLLELKPWAIQPVA